MTAREIAQDLAARITRGEYPADEPLPSYVGLAELYSVSRSTAHRVYTILVTQGVVEGVPGRGMYRVEQ